MNLAALLRVFTRDLYEFDLYDLFLERISRTNRGIPVLNKLSLGLMNFGIIQFDIINFLF